MKNAALSGKPYAGNSHVRFDEGEVASYPPTVGRPEGATTRVAKPRRGSLLYSVKTPAVVAFLSCAALAGAEPIPFERTEDAESIAIGARQRVADHTLLYAETIPSYSLYQNFLHCWIDRPLYFDRALRPDLGSKFLYDNKESFLLAQRDALKSGLEGLGTFGNFSSRFSSFKSHAEWIAESGLPGFRWLPITLYGESGMDGMPPPEKFVEFIKYALASPVTPEIGGKKLIATYNTRCFSLDTHRAFCRKLREEIGSDRYLLVGDYPHRAIEELRAAFRRNGRLSPDEASRLEKMTTDLLDIFDGLDLRAYEYVRTYGGPYVSTIDMSFFDRCLKPVLLDVYSRPRYRGKLFGMYIIQGYINCHSGMNHGEFGTVSLRKMMRSAAALNPDFLVFFEWNEQNENTMFQPTVYSGQTVGRLVKWYSDTLNGRSLSVYGDDDRSVPNITLSHRVVFKPGEKLRFEILNIPDGDMAVHEVRLSLKDENGRTLVEFPTERMPADRLGSVTYAVPGEAFAVGSSTVPVLTVDGVAYDGFHPVRCDATVCRNYKDVRQGLRDRLSASRTGLTVERTDEGRYRASADVEFGEELSSLELVGNEDEVDAFDPSGEFDRTRYDILQLGFSAAPGTTGGGQIEVAFGGADGLEMVPDWKADVNTGPVKWTAEDTVRLNTHWWTRPETFFLKFPKGRVESASATVRVIDGKHAGGKTVTIPFGKVWTLGSWASEINSATGFRVDVSRMDVLPDVPKAPRVRSAKWETAVRTADRNPTFHLRAISKSGKIWRSTPVRPLRNDGKMAEIPVFSEWLHRPITVKAPSGQVRNLDYRFTPERGDVLACSDPAFDATLGGGYAPGNVFTSPTLVKGTPDRALAPKWIEEGGRWILRFDGENDYVNFPIEAFPVGAFTLRMGIRPEPCSTNMVLFRHGSTTRGSLALFIVKGELYAIWPKRVYDWLDHEGSTLRFATGLRIESGKWNDLEVSYDLKTVSFRVGGEKREYPLGERGYLFGPSSFGGHVRRGDIAPPGPLTWFKGDLKGFSIWHGCDL